MKHLALAGGLAFGLASLVAAKPGDSCMQSNNRLTPDTNQFRSDCGYTAWCDSDGICKANGCRKDEYPFGYETKSAWPPLCPAGQFCPDESSSCLNLQPVGGACQLNRDDECAPPPSGTSDDIKSICLHFKCEYTNATLNQVCINENTVYTVFVGASDTYGDIVSRDNCAKGLYCDAPTLQCLSAKNTGESCRADKECRSYNCDGGSSSSSSSSSSNLASSFSGKCVPPPNMPAPPAAWVYVLVVLGLVGGGLLLCVLLFRFHAGQRRQRNQAIKTYYAEQERYRDEIADMHDAAKESVADFASLRSSSSYFAASPPATVAERERERERPTPGPSNLRNLAAAAAASGDLDAGLGLSTSSRTIQQTETRDPAAAGTGTAPAQAPTSNARESQAWRTSLLDFYERPETRARARAESQHEGTEEDEEEEDDVSDRTSEPAQNGLVPSSSQPRRGQNAGWAF